MRRIRQDTKAVEDKDLHPTQTQKPPDRGRFFERELILQIFQLFKDLYPLSRFNTDCDFWFACASIAVPAC